MDADDRDRADGAARGAADDADRKARGAAIGLLGVVALTHLVDLPHKLEEAPYIAALFIALIAASLGLALVAAAGSRPQAIWTAIGALNATAIAGYLASRSVGLPGIEDHVGDWLDSAGIIALASETLLVSLALEELFQRVERPVGLSLRSALERMVREERAERAHRGLELVHVVEARAARPVVLELVEHRRL